MRVIDIMPSGSVRVLSEGNASDLFIIRLTDTILRVFAERVPAHLARNVRRYRKYYDAEALRNPEFLGRLSIGEIADRLPPASPQQRRFLERQADLSIGFRFDQPGYLAAYFHNRPGQRTNLINVRLPDAVMDALVTPILQGKRLRPAAVLAVLSGRRSELVHELRHAYDDAVSGGRFSQNRRSQAAAAALRQRAPEATALYYNDPLEISARLTASLGRHIAAVNEPFNEFATRVMHDFHGWTDVPAIERKQLLRRIASFYLHRRAEPQSNV